MTQDSKSQPGATFAHPSEAEFARILDFYQVAWEYEPRTFELRWDDEGNVLEAFSPDFYLPEQDLYIELTTMEQRLITKKHRKLRRLRKLYPDVSIKLLNRSDFKQMMLKYGLDDDESLIG
jgi:hypoxanthine phosphoribosyltransferase